MNLFGFSITRRPVTETKDTYVPGTGWYSLIREPFTGAWQRNMEINQQTALSFHAVFACTTLIASDIAKLPPRLVQRDVNGIWKPVDSPAYSPVLRKPNRYQNRIQFWEHWMLSKLTTGNTYVLKERDQRNVVTALYILDPRRVQVREATDGSVFYELSTDYLGGIPETTITVPAREIIHDRMNAGLTHPLCGVSPLFAAGLAAQMGLNIQHNSERFFANNAQPGGILTADTLQDKDKQAIKETFEQQFGARRYGSIAVLAGGLKYQPLAMTAADAQLIEQLKWPAEVVCGVYHVPAYKIGIGPPPLNNNVQALNVEYYSQCLQKLLEDAELCMDEGLGIGDGVGPEPYVGCEFDVDNLLRMDTAQQMAALKDGVSAAIYSPNEARLKFNLPPVEGGDVPFLQEQNWPVTVLAEREMPTRPPTAPAPTDPPAAAPEATSASEDTAAAKAIGIAEIRRRIYATAA